MIPRNKFEFAQFVGQQYQIKVGLELGVWKGEYSEILLQQTKLTVLYLCDSWCVREDLQRMNKAYGDNQEHEKNFRLTQERVKGYINPGNTPRCHFLRMDSLEASKQIYDGELDFIYIDGNHEYSAVLADCQAWFPKVRKGGIFSGHDFVDLEHEVGSFGVKSAVTKFLTENGYPNINATIEDPNASKDCFFPTWWIVK